MFKVALAYLPNAVIPSSLHHPQFGRQGTCETASTTVLAAGAPHPPTSRFPTPLSRRTRNMTGSTSRPSRASLPRVGIPGPSPTPHT